MRPIAVAACLMLVSVPGLPAQNQWVPPQPPCGIEPGHFRVNSAVVNLKVAAERPEQRDRMLRQTLDVLVRSIRDDKQDKNPAVWYYLGRYYVEVGDAAGADSAFDRAEALVPQCRADIAGYRSRLAEDALNRGLAAWQEGNPDSAALLLRRAYAINPSSPKPLFQLGSLYVDRNQLDSAAAVMREAAQAAGSDTAYAAAKREALLTVARLAFRRSQADPAIQQWQRARYSRDSIAPHLAADSAVLARMHQSSASRRARGARLSPMDQQSFSRDSAARADAVARGAAAREALRQQASSDSAAAQPAYDPVITAYRELVAAYPSNSEAATTLAAIFAQAGRMGQATGTFDALFAHATELSTTELYELGQRLVQGNQPGPGIQAYNLALQQNPYHRNALAEIANAYLAAKDTAKALTMARRLVALDPLNRAALRLLAQTLDQQGAQDSAQRYAKLADTLTVDVSVASLVTDSAGVTLTGVASNLGSVASKPFRIMVELLDAQGSVQGSQPVDIPALQPGANHQFEVKARGRGLVGWRYRPS